MHPLIDSAMVETIRTTGKTAEGLPDRTPILRLYGLPYDRPAPNVVVTGCQILGALPEVLATLSRILDQGGVDHTFLSTEYCCGNNLYRPAIAARDEAGLAEARGLSREFVGRNLSQAKALGARRLILFCSPCYPIYRHAFPEADIVFYPQALLEAAPALKLDRKVDYYAGCYRLHKRFAPAPMELASTNELLGRIQGLEVNRISAPACCYKPEGLAHMLESTQTRTLVHICTGCYFQAKIHMPAERGVNVLMLPELAAQAMDLKA